LKEWGEIERKEGEKGIRALCKGDRYYLLVRALKRSDLLHPWLYCRCREVETSPDGYLDLWGREHYKSTIITYGGIIQEVLRNPNTTVGIFSHTAPIAKSFLAQIKREFESNEILRRVFPDIIWGNPWKEAPVWSLDGGIVLKRNINPKEATIEAHGLVDGQPTGKHYQLLVYDDVVTKESVATPEQIAKTTSSWELSDNLGVQGGRKWHTGTRYSFSDTYEAIISRGAVKPRLYPATANGLITGEPVLFSVGEWERRVRDQGEATISCQMLQNPIAGQQRMFDITDLKIYEIRPQTLQVYVLVDPARSQKRGSDNTAIAVIGIDYAGNKYLLDGYRHKMDLTERWVRTRDMYRWWGSASGVQGIAVGYESYGAQSDLDYFRERQRIERIPFQIEELAWPRDGEGSKVDRVQRLTPDVRNGRFYIPYQTDAKNLTRIQREMLDSGQDYRIARKIIHKGTRESGKEESYDLTEDFKMEMHYFPFAGKKDLIDAVSRIFDMEPVTPGVGSNQYVEPAIP
jgi:phage terminase large subunit-like protein